MPEMTAGRPPVCDYEGSDYQTAFWEQGGRAYEDQVEAVALRRLLPRSGSLLLELGAGAGRNTLRYGQFERIVLLDYSRSQLQQAQERLGRDNRYVYVAADVYRLPFAPGQFEAATMIRTLHHMADARRALVQIRQALQPGAVFILEFANKQNLKAILRYLLGRQTWNPFTPDPVEFASLNFDFHPKAIRAWLRESGFAIEGQLTVSHFRMGLLKRWLPLGLLVALDSAAQLTGNWWQLTPSVFVRARVTAKAEPGSSQPRVSDLQFRCLECDHFPLEEAADGVVCPSCSRRWPVREGIYDFRESAADFSTTQK
jgi:ubiquinone/menaquinone biosynthesis C-methylase UbiE